MAPITKHLNLVCFLWVLSLVGGSISCKAQEKEKPDATAEVSENEYKEQLPSYSERLKAQKLNRKIRLAMPNPRGEILGEYYNAAGQRKHTVLATSRNGRYFQIDFSSIIKETNPIAIHKFAQEKIAWINQTLGRNETLSEYETLTYFEHRRWIPLRVGSILEKKDIEKLRRVQLPVGLSYLDMPIRYYPKGAMAAHVLGAVKRSKGWPLRAFAEGDELFPPIDGLKGLEKAQNAILQGKHTIFEYRFDKDGNQMAPIVVDQGRPGLNIILTIDTEMQALTEAILKKRTAQSGTGKGAMVVLDAETMQIKALASWPMFDPNDYVPVLTSQVQAKWAEDKNNPLIARAFQAAYPPASVFKLATAFIAVGSGQVGANEARYPCLNSVTYHNNTMRNWTQEPGQPFMTMHEALKRSCNTWFFQAANEMQKSNKFFEKWFHATMPMFGLGKRTGLGLAEESAGYMYVKDGKAQPFFEGAQVANVSIGQGELLTTPLQMAQMVARIANSSLNTKAHMVRGRQDDDGNWMGVAQPLDEKVNLSRYENVLAEVRLGMWDVVYGPQGTGTASNPGGYTVAGKTGTAQWGANRNVAWYGSYAPFYNGSPDYPSKPKYVVISMQEGNSGQELAGGNHGAPLVGDFYRSAYVRKRISEHMNGGRADQPAAVERGVLRALPVEEGEY
jgi:penicillin-binding protein 2